MAPASIEDFDHRRRSAAGCLCCGSRRLRRQVQLVSGFLAERAWNGAPQLTELVTCETCGLRFFERGLDDDEVARYYLGYRNAAYQRRRQQWEPFYTPRRHLETQAWSDSPGRLANLRQSLALARAPARFTAALDHGGNQGHMLAAIDADRKAVYDPSASPAVAGVESYSIASDLPGGWSLVLCCQVLEHVSSPAAYLKHIRELLADGGWLYLEVPNERWRDAPGAKRMRRIVLEGLLRLRPLLIAADAVCTASRIKFGRLPPLGFIAMREHLNYFTRESLAALLSANGFRVEICGIEDGGQLFAVARKFGTLESKSAKTTGDTAC